MKKLLFLLSIILSSCTCLIGQVPPVTLQITEECGAALPDYRSHLIFSDNCRVDSIDQTPSPGAWITEKFTTLRFRAFDNFGNYTDVLGSLELIDTVPPTFVGVDSTLIASEFDRVTTLYDQAERIIANMDWWQTWPDSIPVYEDYANYYLVCYSSPLYALRDRLPVENGHRVWTFAKPGSTITFSKAETITIPEL